MIISLLTENPILIDLIVVVIILVLFKAVIEDLIALNIKNSSRLEELKAEIEEIEELKQKNEKLKQEIKELTE